MGLVSGTRFGSYEVGESIGVGGMGEVYRATDTNLKRAVAIKVLPEAFASDADRLARFQLEAEVLASLNHLNIAQVYGLERSGDQTAIVMELIDGPTLADRIEQGPIPTDEALTIAAQIANGIEAAHDQGIVHRDLKPANIKLRPDGIVRILDFGIAKNLGLTAASGSGAPALTTPAMTETGMILGTASYMSPEQARGKPLDKRTDIWAFGAIVYEMLTGQPPFLGEDVAETIAAVLKTEPNWSALPELPPLLLMFLKQCLAKDPSDRIHDIADVRLALLGKYDALAAGAAGVGDRTGTQSRAPAVWAATLAVIAVIAAAGIAYWVSTESQSGSSTVVRQLTFWNGNIGNARFASDGQVIVYGAERDGEPYRLYTTRRDSYQSRPIDLEPTDLLSVSSNNRLALSIGRPAADGWLPRGRLAEVDLAGGAATVIDDGVVSLDYGPDGSQAAIVRRVGGLSRVEFPIGTVVHESGQVSPVRVSPDGGHICFPANYGSLMVAGRGERAEELVPGTARITGCAWHPDGDQVWFTYSPTGSTHSNVESVGFDGEGRRVLAALPSYAEIMDISPDGAALVASGMLRYSAHGAAAGDAGERDLSVFDASRVASMNAAGTHLLILDNSSGSIAGGFLFLRPMDGSPARQMGALAPLAMMPDASSIIVLGDGSSFAFAGSDAITLIPIGGGQRRTVSLGVVVQSQGGNLLGTNVWDTKFAEVSDDGRRLLLPFGREADRPPRAYVHDFNEGWTRAITPEGVIGPVIMSPDGMRLASNEPDGLYVYSVDTGERRVVPGGPDPGVLSRWSALDDTVYLVEPNGPRATIVERNLLTGERVAVREVRVPDPAGVTRFDLWVARDGEAYAYTLDRNRTNLFLFEGLDAQQDSDSL